MKGHVVHASDYRTVRGASLSLAAQPLRVGPTNQVGPACTNTRPLATGQANPVPPRGEGYPRPRSLEGEEGHSWPQPFN